MVLWPRIHPPPLPGMRAAGAEVVGAATGVLRGAQWMPLGLQGAGVVVGQGEHLLLRSVAPLRILQTPVEDQSWAKVNVLHLDLG